MQVTVWKRGMIILKPKLKTFPFTSGIPTHSSPKMHPLSLPASFTEPSFAYLTRLVGSVPFDSFFPTIQGSFPSSSKAITHGLAAERPVCRKTELA